MNERRIFLAAMEIDDPERRAAYLAQSCGDDADLRRSVEELLAAQSRAAAFLETPAAGEHATLPDAGASDVTLDFLTPSDDPHSLGRLGAHEIVRVVGHGGMGLVLEARDTRLNRVVAVKVLAPALATNAQARQRFLREARAAAAVSHDNVVTIFAVEEGPDSSEQTRHRGTPPYLVMEYVHGQSLQELLDVDGALDVKRVLRIGAQIAAGLGAAHRQGLVHRDVKPANILLENGIERVKITDFGLARAVDDVSITQSGVLAGTPQYMSPEQAQGRSIDRRSDLFGLGCVLYALCTGRPPFRGETTMAVLKQVSQGRPRPVRDLNPDAPGWLVEIVEQLLEKDPERRFQSAQEVADLLERRLAWLQQPAAAARPRRLQTQWRYWVHRRRGWLAAALVCLACAVALGASEATGVTNLSATLIRIVTGAGTLAIEVDDPTVRVSVDGEEVRIRGAGLEELTLRPGRYQFEAVRDGATIQQELVTITRGQRRVVRVVVEPTPSRPTVDDAAPGGAGPWVSLFNGKDLTGWETHPDARDGWTVQSGVLFGFGNAHLFSVKEYRDFHLRLETRCYAGTGVNFRASFTLERLAPPSEATYPRGYNAFLVRRSGPSAQTVFSLGKEERVVSRHEGIPDEFGRWHTLEIIAQANRIRVKVDGDTTADYLDAVHDYPQGRIALYPVFFVGVAEFRRIEIRELSSEVSWPGRNLPPAAVSESAAGGGEWTSLFNGKDLTGWKVHPDQPGGWRVEDGELVGSGHYSHLFSERGDYENFHLRAEAKINERGNSGIFFRSEFGLNRILTNEGYQHAFPWGYEAQICTDDHDPPRTGSLWGFGPRATVSEDLVPPDTWFTMEVIANGSHLVIKVNGRTTVDLVDRQDTYRRGHFALQAFFTGVAVRFRNIEVRELPPGPARPDHATLESFLPEAVLLMNFDKETFYEEDSKTYVRDLSGLGHDGLCQGALFTPDGQSGGGLACRAGHLELPRAFVNSQSSYTMTAWIRVDAASNEAGVLRTIYVEADDANPDGTCYVLDCDRGAGTSLGVSAWNLDRRENNWKGARTAERAYAFDTWLFVAATLTDAGVDHGELRLQVDDRVFFLQSQQISSPAQVTGLLGRALGGVIDEVAIFPRALSQDEIAAIRRQGMLGRTLDPAPALAGAPFVLLGGKGIAERKFDTLAEAVMASNEGDTIEVRGNGPFPCEPIEVWHRLTIRAAPDVQPRFLVTNQLTGPDPAFVTAFAPLVLEGLDVREAQGAPFPYAMVRARSGTLRVANCRFQRQTAGSLVAAWSAPLVVLRNCLLLGGDVYLPVGNNGVASLENNVLACERTALRLGVPQAEPRRGFAITLRRNTLVAANPLWHGMPRGSPMFEPQSPLLTWRAEENAIDAREALLSVQFLRPGPSVESTFTTPGERERLWSSYVQWQGAQNVYPADVVFRSVEPPSSQSEVQTLAAWTELVAENGSLQGPLRYVGGDVLSMLSRRLDAIGPEEFRLHADSTGKGAAADGGDLGADIDLVGPGEAYERCKRTPEYEAWLMETSALSGDGPEKGAFVVLDGTGIAERGFATLAEAVFAARDGDTIEVRASGPFVTQPLFPKGNALTIRAADGHRPVFTVRAEGARPFLPLLHTNAPLTLEGLEFHRHDAQEWEPLTSPPKLIVSRGAPLHAANCRFVFKTPGVVELLGSPIGNFRNCEFISTSRIFWMGGVACDSPAGSRLQMHNCVIAGGGAGLALWHSKPKSDDVEVQLTRNTLTRGVAVAFCLNSVPDDAASDGQPPQPPFRIHSAHNVFDVQAAVLRFEQGPLYLKQAKEPLTSGDAERLLPRLVAWHEQGSRFSLGSAEWLTFSELGQLRPLEHPITSAADWQRFWGGRPETVAAGRVRFQGGNVRQKAITVPDLVNREDFRLRGGSGEDPGANVDFVGPGEAYERWQRTPEYQAWLTETSQVMSPDDPDPQGGAHNPAADVVEAGRRRLITSN